MTLSLCKMQVIGYPPELSYLPNLKIATHPPILQSHNPKLSNCIGDYPPTKLAPRIP